MALQFSSRVYYLFVFRLYPTYYYLILGVILYHDGFRRRSSVVICDLRFRFFIFLSAVSVALSMSNCIVLTANNYFVSVNLLSYLIISRHIKLRDNVRTLRSATTARLSEPFASTAFAKRAFRCSTPATWNSLPRTVTDSNSLGTFKSRLKTFLFSLAYN